MGSLKIEIIEEKSGWKVPGVGILTSQQAREYLPTFATECAVFISQIIVYKLAAHYLGKNGFSQYAVARRTVALLVPIPLLGLGVGLPRYIGHSSGSQDPNLASAYYGASLRYVTLATLVCVLIVNLMRNYFAFIFFGNAQYSRFVLPSSLMLAGLSLHAIVYGYFRGHLAMRQANVLQITNLGLVPPICFIFFHKSAEQVLLVLGIFWTSIALGGLSFTPFRCIAAVAGSRGKELLRYGVQRLPGDFIMVAFLALPVTFVAHESGIQRAGFVAFGISILSMIGAVFTPIGLILLPKASFMLVAGLKTELRNHVITIAKATLAVTLFLFLLIETFSRQLIRLYLGPQFYELVPIIRMVATATVPFGFYFSLRGLVDAFHTKGINTINIAIAFSVFLVLSGCFIGQSGAIFLVLPLIIGLYVLAILTVLETHKILIFNSSSQ